MPNDSRLANIRVVLVEPSHPGNIGAAARAMKTMGLTDLVLVDRKKQVREALASKRIRSAAPTSGGFSSSGYSAGAKAGREASLATSKNQVGSRKALSA